MNKFTRRRMVAGAVAMLVTTVLTVLFVRVPVAEASVALPSLVADVAPVQPCDDVAARCDLSTVFPNGARFALSVVPTNEFVCADGWMARMVTVWVETGGVPAAKVAQPACSTDAHPFGGGVADVLPGLFEISAALYW